jgi:thiamine-monophosphate kinase
MPPANARDYALTGGDDYEVCFSAPPRHVETVRELAARFSTRVTAIGKITTGDELVVLDENGASIPLANTGGYRHF